MDNYERIRATAGEVQAIMQRFLDRGIPLGLVIPEGWQMIRIAVREILTEGEITTADRPFEQLIAWRWAFQLAMAGLKDQPEPKFPGWYEQRISMYHRSYVFSWDIYPNITDEEERVHIAQAIHERILKETLKTMHILADAGMSFESVMDEGRRVVIMLKYAGQEPVTDDQAAQSLFQQMKDRFKRATNARRRRQARSGR